MDANTSLSPRATSCSLMIVLTLFALIWTSFTLCLFDIPLAIDLTGQWQSLGFAETEGQIVFCRVLKSGHGDTESYSVGLRYVYVVDGLQHTGSRIRYGPFNRTTDVESFVAEHPAGSRVPVFYDVEDPAESVLWPGLIGESLFLLTFSLPFNAVIVVFVLADLVRITRPFQSERTRLSWQTGIRVIEEHHQTRFRPNRVTPLAHAFVAVFVSSILMVFALGFVTLANPSVPVGLAGLAIVFTIGIFFYARCAWMLASGKYDLIIDREHAMLRMPPHADRKVELTIPFTSLLSIFVVEHLHEDSEGAMTYRQRIRVKWLDGENHETTLLEVNQANAAPSEALATLIRERITTAAE